jgi:hypothetical protein
LILILIYIIKFTPPAYKIDIDIDWKNIKSPIFRKKEKIWPQLFRTQAPRWCTSVKNLFLFQLQLYPNCMAIPQQTFRQSSLSNTLIPYLAR